VFGSPRCDRGEQLERAMGQVADAGAERDLDGSGLSIAVICSRSNEEITKELCVGAQRALAEHGVAGERVETFLVPAAFELPSSQSASPGAESTTR
jgi:6,7-dimethyl-8-ribityllumazine synthase